jgi:hypothetical protein
VRIIEELLEWKNSGSGLTAVGIRCADHTTPSIRKKLALTSTASGGRSVGIVRLRTNATEFIFVCLFERPQVQKGLIGQSGKTKRNLVNANLQIRKQYPNLTTKFDCYYHFM